MRSSYHKSCKDVKRSYAAYHRLRKYARKKHHSFNRYVNLYWRYHHKVYGPCQSLWP